MLVRLWRGEGIDEWSAVRTANMALKKIGSSYRITRSALQKYLGT
jgi:hypothetical protein